jgi:2-(1,2-epoxy-1,2-dihydrophenyl)acetyl-CoA isomerase
VVLAAEGRSFSTGGDVRRFWDERDRLADYATEVVGLLNEVMVGMMRLRQPIVAAVHGPVTGGSLGLVLAADLVLVGPDASFTPWYGPVGFAPDGGWTALLPEVIGRQRAGHVLLTNAAISAREAVEWGLAARLVEGDVRAEALGVAAGIAGQAVRTIGHMKARLRDDLVDIAARLEDERRRFVRQIVTEEALAGMARFLEEHIATPHPP